MARLREEIAGVAARMDDAQAQNEMIGDAVTRATEISEQNAAASVRELSTLGARMFELLQADSVQPAAEPRRAVDLSRGPAA